MGYCFEPDKLNTHDHTIFLEDRFYYYPAIDIYTIEVKF
jgi:hypothetical protein